MNAVNKMIDAALSAWFSSDGALVPTRYFIGSVHESIFGYEPEGDTIPFRVARGLGLSGYQFSFSDWWGSLPR